MPDVDIPNEVASNSGLPAPFENVEERKVLSSEIKRINDSHWSRRKKTSELVDTTQAVN
jgi:hypothetical protein